MMGHKICFYEEILILIPKLSLLLLLIWSPDLRKQLNKVNWYTFKRSNYAIFSSPGQSPGRAIVLPLASASASYPVPVTGLVIFASLSQWGQLLQRRTCSCESKFFPLSEDPSLEGFYSPGKLTGKQKKYWALQNWQENLKYICMP